MSLAFSLARGRGFASSIRFRSSSDEAIFATAPPIVESTAEAVEPNFGLSPAVSCRDALSGPIAFSVTDAIAFRAFLVPNVSPRALRRSLMF